jgi:hypothetical protein
VTLAQLLTDGERHAPEYRGGLSNHRPMALLALQQLGADDARLQAWAAAYDARLQPAPPSETWPAGDAWTGRLGEPAAWPAYRSLFAEWIGYEGDADVLGQVLPALMPGCGAAAFHGPIRVAAAVRAGHGGELADALAYWACRWLPLGPLPDGRGAESDPEVLVRQLPRGSSARELIFERMQDAARLPALPQTLSRLAVDGATLQRLARLSAKAYALSGNFTALHLVTGCHAMQVLSDFVDDDGTALRWFWQAWATGVVAAGMKMLPAPALRSWGDIVQKALACDDEHVIKLVDSCRELERACGSGDWRLAASRAVG